MSNQLVKRSRRVDEEQLEQYTKSKEQLATVMNAEVKLNEFRERVKTTLRSVPEQKREGFLFYPIFSRLVIRPEIERTFLTQGNSSIQPVQVLPITQIANR